MSSSIYGNTMAAQASTSADGNSTATPYYPQPYSYGNYPYYPYAHPAYSSVYPGYSVATVPPSDSSSSSSSSNSSSASDSSSPTIISSAVASASSSSMATGYAAYPSPYGYDHSAYYYGQYPQPGYYYPPAGYPPMTSTPPPNSTAVSLSSTSASISAAHAVSASGYSAATNYLSVVAPCPSASPSPQAHSPAPSTTTDAEEESVDDTAGNVANVNEEEEGKVVKRKGLLELQCDSRYNMNEMIVTNILESMYWQKIRDYSYDDVLKEVQSEVKHVEPFVSSKHTSLVSTAFCLLYKLFTVQLTVKQIRALLQRIDCAALRCLALLYLRYGLPPTSLWSWFSPLLHDSQLVPSSSSASTSASSSSSSKSTVTVGQFVKDLLTETNYRGTVLPRIPVTLQRDLKKMLLVGDMQWTRVRENERYAACLAVGDELRAQYVEDGQFYQCKIEAIDSEEKIFTITFTDYEGDKHKVHIGAFLPEDLKTFGRQRKEKICSSPTRERTRSTSPKKRKRSRSRSRSRSRDRDRDRNRQRRRERDSKRSSRSHSNSRARSRSRSTSRSRSPSSKPTDMSVSVNLDAAILRQEQRAAVSRSHSSATSSGAHYYPHSSSSRRYDRPHYPSSTSSTSEDKRKAEETEEQQKEKEKEKEAAAATAAAAKSQQDAARQKIIERYNASAGSSSNLSTGQKQRGNGDDEVIRLGL